MYFALFLSLSLSLSPSLFLSASSYYRFMLDSQRSLQCQSLGTVGPGNCRQSRCLPSLYYFAFDWLTLRWSRHNYSKPCDARCSMPLLSAICSMIIAGICYSLFHSDPCASICETLCAWCTVRLSASLVTSYLWGRRADAAAAAAAAATATPHSRCEQQQLDSSHFNSCGLRVGCVGLASSLAQCQNNWMTFAEQRLLDSGLWALGSRLGFTWIQYIYVTVYIGLYFCHIEVLQSIRINCLL